MNRLGVAAAAACALAACGGFGGTGGIPQAQAVRLARTTAQGMSSIDVTLVSAVSGELGTYVPNAGRALGDPSREVWIVVFTGAFQGSCGAAPVPPAAPHPCPPPNSSVRVVLDYISGAFIVAETPATGATVRITRTPGLLTLPTLDRTLTDVAVVTRLGIDIRRLPVFPSGTFSCPSDSGTSYTLAFTIAGESPWSAVVNMAGCRGVTLSNSTTRWAATADFLFTDLSAALGITHDELIPCLC